MLQTSLNRRQLPTENKYKMITLRANKNAQRSMLSKVYRKIDRELKAHPGRRLPYSFVSKLVTEMKQHFPWITRDKVMIHQRKQTSLAPTTEEPKIDAQIATDRNISGQQKKFKASVRSKGGHSIGHTNARKRQIEKASVAVINEITALYDSEMEKTQIGERVPKCTLKTITNKVKTDRNLSPEFFCITGNSAPKNYP